MTLRRCRLARSDDVSVERLSRRGWEDTSEAEECLLRGMEHDGFLNGHDHALERKGYGCFCCIFEICFLHLSFGAYWCIAV